MTASQKPPPPCFAAAQTSAAIGSATTTSRNVVTKPSERAAPALSLACVVSMRPPQPGSCGVARSGRSGLRRPARSSTIRPFGGSNHFLSAARQPPIVLSLIVNWPGRTGNFFANFAAACLFTGRKPYWPKTSCAGSDLTNWMNLFARSLFGLFLQDRDRELDQHRLARDHVLDVLALEAGVDRLALVGDQDVALAGEERVRRVRARRVLRDDVLEELLDVGDRLRVGLAEMPLRAVGGEDVPLRRARAERVRA